MKAGICVSTVSIVSTIDAYSFGANKDVLIQPRPIMADATDGADGMFGTRAHTDHSRSCSAFARERDLDAQRPQERLRPPQSTGERPRISCLCATRRDVIASTLRIQTQKRGELLYSNS
jgi:hypothetical protein